MQKQLTLEDIARLRAETKDPILLAILDDAEWKLGEGHEIIWDYPDPIPPRPWAINTGKIIGANGARVADISAIDPASPLISQFIVDRVNGEEDSVARKIIEELTGYIDEVHVYLDAIGTTSQASLVTRVKIATECNDIFVKTVTSALEILDEIGVPDPADSTSIAPLLDRLRILQRTGKQAHSILDSMGVPKAENAECNHSDCNSLIDRLHTFRDSFGYQLTPEARNAAKTKCHQIVPCQPTENQYVTILHVLDTLCALCAETVRDIFEYRQAADCFCGQNPQRHADDYRFSSAVLRFITDAVREKIAAVRQKWPIQWPTPE